MDTAASNRKRRQEKRAAAVSEYKELTRRIREFNRNDPIAEVQEQIRFDLERANELYPIVKKKLDGTSADSKHMRELYNLCQEVSKRINATSKPFELKSIIKNLMRRANEDTGENLSKSDFFRYITENHVNTFLLAPPTFEFFYGALTSEDLVVRDKKRRRIMREKPDESTQHTVTAKEKDIELDVEQDTTPKEVEYINNQIKRLASSRREGVSFFETIVDPESFTHTVENIFHISFLVKESKLGLKRDDSGEAVLTIDESDSSGGREGESESNTQTNGQHKAAQSILSFSMDDYKNWISKFNITKRSFAPRQDSG